MYELIKTLPYWMQISLLFIPALSFFIAATAFLINLRQTVLNNRLRRAKIVADSLKGLMDDDAMHDAFYKIEYSKFQYTDGFHGSDEEKKVDRLLRHFSNIALMRESNLLRIRDIHPVQYFILRTMNDPGIIEYLKFIDSWSEVAETGSHPYSSLKNLFEKLSKSR